MSIRLTLIMATAIATLVGSPAFAWRNDTENLRPSYYTADGKWHMGRPHHEHAITPMQQNDWWWGGSHH
jgi:hypothetical protein